MRFRWIVILSALGMSLFMLFQPPEKGGAWQLDNLRENINLGLDLRGGVFMQLEVDVDDAVQQYLEEQAGTMKASLAADEIAVDTATPDFDRGSVRLTGVSAPESINILRTTKDRYSGFWFVDQESNGDLVMKLKEVAKTQVQDDAVNQTVYKIQNRIDQLGVTEPNITRTLGSNRIVLELAGADDVERVNKIVREPGKLEWRLMEPGTGVAATEAELLATRGGTLPAGRRMFPYLGDSDDPSGFALLQEVLLTSTNVANVFPTQDDKGLPAVGINLNRAGAQIFSTVTGQNIGNRLAIVLDGKVILAPVIQAELSDNFQITGNFSQQEVQDTVIKIKSGSLPAEVRILEERVIGPSLGRDAIRQGTLAAMIGLVLVMAFIMLYYRRAGIYALFALVINLVLILGMIAGMGAVLTLPGIAGFILTIGMAVDANVLVFERIREELRTGTPVRQAVEVGYKSAFVTIMDANITTFIAAFCLLLMGQGPIKGFAVMLMIGIVSSIFTAVFCSRTFFLQYLNRHPSLRRLSIWPIWRSTTGQTAN